MKFWATGLRVNNTTMTGEPMHTALEERMAPGLLFAPEHTPQHINYY